MLNSFTYIFKDNKWLIKFITAFIFIGIFTYGSHFYLVQNRNSEFILSFRFWFPMAIGCLVSYIILFGYKIINVKAFQVTKTNKIVPFMRLAMDFKTGFKYACALAMFHLCWHFLLAVFGLITGLSFGTQNKFLITLCCSLMLLTFVSYIVYWLISEFGYIYMFAENPSFLTFFKIKELFSNIWNHKKQYFTALGLNILLCIAVLGFYMLINYFLMYNLNEIGALLVNTIIVTSAGTYKFFVSNMLISKSLEENQSSGE